MLAERSAHPECDCRAVHGRAGFSVQYWRSFDHLEAYARSAGHAQWPARTAFNRQVRANSGDVGIWHDAYLVPAGEYETLYRSVPRMGLARAGQHLPIADHLDTPRQRLRAGGAGVSPAPAAQGPCGRRPGKRTPMHAVGRIRDTHHSSLALPRFAPSQWR